MAIQTAPVQSLEGLWTFEIPGLNAGGVVVIADGHINGGDSEFYISGLYTVTGDDIEADITIRRFRGSSPPLMGKEGDSLVVVGKLDREKSILELWHRQSGRLWVSLEQRVAFPSDV